MAAAWVSTPAGTAHFETSGRHFQIPLSRNVPAGRQLVMLLATSGTTAIPSGYTVSGPRGNVWTSNGAGLLSPQLFTFIHSAPITTGLLQGDVISFDLDPSHPGIHLWAGYLLEATGLAVANGMVTVDVQQSGTGANQANVNLVSAQQTTQAGDLLVGVLACGAGSTFTPSHGTKLGPILTTAGAADKQMVGVAEVTSGKGTQSLAGTLAPSAAWAGALVAFKPAASNFPVPRLTATPLSGAAPLAVAFDGSTSSDPAGQALTFAYDFGDGSRRASSATATASHTYPTAGTYSAQLTVTDTDGLAVSTSKTITVTGGAGGAASMTTTPAGTGSVDASSRNIVITLNRAVTAGKTLFLGLACSSLTTSSTFSAFDSTGKSWSLDAYVNYQPSIQSVLLSVSVTADLPAGTTITGQVLAAESQLAKWNGIVMEGAGIVAGATRVGPTVADTGAAAAVSLTTAGSAAVGDLVVGMLTVGGSTAVFTPDAGVSASAPVSNTATPAKQGIMLWKVATVAGPQTLSGTWDGANRWTMGVAVYKAAGGGGAPPPVAPSRILIVKNGVLSAIPQPLYASGGVLV